MGLDVVEEEGERGDSCVAVGVLDMVRKVLREVDEEGDGQCDD